MFFLLYKLRLAESAGKVFKATCTLQIVISTPFLAINIYNFLSPAESNSDQAGVRIVYVTVALTQIFLYCWFGNAVMSKVRYTFI